MMQYKLTEEMSTKFYNDLKYLVDAIDRLQPMAVDAFESLYDDYTNNHTSFFGFKPMSIEKFGKKISMSKGIVIVDFKNGQTRQLKTLDGWAANLRTAKIAKLTKNQYVDILGQCSLITSAICANTYRTSEYDVWTTMIERMEQYMQVPYTIDQEWLDVLENLPREINYYKIAMNEVTNATTNTNP